MAAPRSDGGSSGAPPDDTGRAVVHTPGMPPEPSDRSLDDLARRARIGEAVRERHRRASAAARRLEDLTIVSALLGAMDGAVAVHTSCDADVIAGDVVAVGDDIVELATPTHTWWVRLTGIVAIEAAELAPGDPADRSATSMVDLLADLVDTDRTVQVRCDGGHRLAGSITAVGAALSLRDGSTNRSTLVQLDRLVAVAVRGS